MLQTIREKSQGWIAAVIVIVVCIPFVLWGVQSYLYHNTVESIVAKVDGVKITQREFDNAYNQARRQRLIKYGHKYTFSPREIKDLKRSTLQELINNLVLTQAARNEGFHIARELAEISIAKMAVFQVKGVFSKSRFLQIVSSLLYTPEQFIEQIKSNLTLTQIKAGIINSSFVFPGDVSRVAGLLYQRRKFNYVIIPTNYFALQIKVDNKDIEHYYEQHKDEFRIPEKVSVDYLKLSIDGLIKKINPSQQQLRNYYQENIHSYTRPKQLHVSNILISIPQKHPTSKQLGNAKSRIDIIYKKLKNGESFNKLVKQYSQDNLTKANYGIMPWLTLSQLTGNVRSALAFLNKTGQIAKPVRTARGYEIFKLLKLKHKKILDFVKVKDKVRLAYQRKKAQDQFTDLSDQLANVTYEHPNSLQPAAKQLGLNMKTTAEFTKQGGKQKITRDSKIIAASFSDEVINQKLNSEVINLNDSSVVVLHVNKYQPALIKPLVQVKSQIKSAILKKRGNNLANKLGQKMLDILKQNILTRKLSEKYKLIFHSINYVDRYDKNVNAEILKYVFDISPPAKINKANNLLFNLSNGDVAIFSLIDIRNGSLKSIAANKQKDFSIGIENSFGMQDYQIYVRDLMDRSKIQYVKDFSH